MKKTLIKAFAVVAALYIGVCALLYFFQEKIIFHPQKLGHNYAFEFAEPFEELNIKTDDGVLLNGALFKSDSSQGVIFYLHGNGGSVGSWGVVAKTYLDLHYDVFFLDYRGYGKSDGTIRSQDEIFNDSQTVYNFLKTKYPEEKIIVLGYSIGTGPASKVASDNSPQLLILQAPYYSLTDVMRTRYPFIPTFILKYKFATNEYLKNCRAPVVIFHGDRDEVVRYNSSVKLKNDFPNVTLITLHDQGHNRMTDNAEYKLEITRVLSK
jgi:pimeloyl-ACP methyl ester carboxylesterase